MAEQKGSSSPVEVEVLVRDLAGEPLLGPALFPPDTVVSDVRQSVLQLLEKSAPLPSGSGLYSVSLLHEGMDLSDDDCLSLDVERIECTAVVDSHALQAEERSKILNRTFKFMPCLCGPSWRTRCTGGARSYCSFKSLSELVRAERAIVKKFVRKDWRCLEIDHPRFRADRAIVLEACKSRGKAITLASPELRQDREFLLDAIRIDAEVLQYAPPAMCDRAFVLDAQSRNNKAAGHVPVVVDEDVLLGWIEESTVPAALDRSYVLHRVHQNGMWLLNAPENQTDHEVVMAAVQQNGMALRCTTLVDDRAVVLAAVRENGMALQFASDDLRLDTRVVLEALSNAPRARKFALLVPKFEVGTNFSPVCGTEVHKKSSRRRTRRSDQKEVF
eukprot:TRINITY_DN19242_c0_g1_i3.p1 TRINITY_DN19242_c0_g1~~TRINITY_DN19242_c0_g1_i3.p1  ORF type:complete len:388 (+),score=59.55 TRINITY_DN19242_c0_g1_i3:89-1252(+)